MFLTPASRTAIATATPRVVLRDDGVQNLMDVRRRRPRPRPRHLTSAVASKRCPRCSTSTPAAYEPGARGLPQASQRHGSAP
ncbi:hypothetical protein ACU686_17210 [Yinghuangia aomiensis]